jgi:DNA polymerase-3 subunit delta'
MGRAAFQAKKDASAIHDLILWSEKIAGLGRETKKFLQFCIEMFISVDDELRD